MPNYSDCCYRSFNIKVAIFGPVEIGVRYIFCIECGTYIRPKEVCCQEGIKIGHAYCGQCGTELNFPSGRVRQNEQGRDRGSDS